MRDLVAWLRRMKPTRIKVGEQEYPAPAIQPWQSLADLCSDAPEVWAYRDDTLQGIWRRPAENASPGVDPMAHVGAMLQAQAAFFKEMMGLQVASLRGVREALEVSASLRPSIPQMLPGADDDDDGAAQRDEALLQAFMSMRAAQPPPSPVAPNGAKEAK